MAGCRKIGIDRLLACCAAALLCAWFDAGIPGTPGLLVAADECRAESPHDPPAKAVQVGVEPVAIEVPIDSGSRGILEQRLAADPNAVPNRACRLKIVIVPPESNDFVGLRVLVNLPEEKGKPPDAALLSAKSPYYVGSHAFSHTDQKPPAEEAFYVDLYPALSRLRRTGAPATSETLRLTFLAIPRHAGQDASKTTIHVKSIELALRADPGK